MFCHECGAKVKNEGKFCAQCGARLLVTNNEEMSDEQGKSVENSSKPIMKRREYFSTVDEKKIKNKVKALNILTVFMLAICGISYVFLAIANVELGKLRNEMSIVFGENSSNMFFAVSVMSILFGCVIAMILSILILRFKHFGLVIPLLYFDIYPLMVCKGGIYKLLGGKVIDAIIKGHAVSNCAEPLQMVSQQVGSIFSLGMYGVLIAMLVLSIQVTRGYNRYRKSN